MSDTLIRAPTPVVTPPAPQAPTPVRRRGVRGLVIAVVVLALALIGLGVYVAVTAWNTHRTADQLDRVAAAWSAPAGGGDQAAALYTENATVVMPGQGLEVSGRGSIAATVDGYVASGFTMTPGAFVRDGDQVTQQFTWISREGTVAGTGMTTLLLQGDLVKHQVTVTTDNAGLGLAPFGPAYTPSTSSANAVEHSLGIAYGAVSTASVPTLTPNTSSANAVEHSLGLTAYTPSRSSANAVEHSLGLAAYTPSRSSANAVEHSLP